MSSDIPRTQTARKRIGTMYGSRVWVTKDGKSTLGTIIYARNISVDSKFYVAITVALDNGFITYTTYDKVVVAGVQSHPTRRNPHPYGGDPPTPQE